MFKSATKFAAPVLILLLAACGGDEGGSDGNPTTPDGDVGLCPYVTGGSLNASCTSCEIVNSELAHDGNPGTYASFVIPALSGGGVVTVRASAAPGTVYPALTQAGAIFGFTGPSGTAVYSDLHIRTYLAGVPVGSDTSFSPSVITGSGDREPERYETLSAGPYDTVEIEYTRAAGTEPVSFNVFEFCGG